MANFSFCILSLCKHDTYCKDSLLDRVIKLFHFGVSVCWLTTTANSVSGFVLTLKSTWQFTNINYVGIANMNEQKARQTTLLI